MLPKRGAHRRSARRAPVGTARRCWPPTTAAPAAGPGRRPPEAVGPDHVTPPNGLLRPASWRPARLAWTVPLGQRWLHLFLVSRLASTGVAVALLGVQDGTGHDGALAAIGLGWGVMTAVAVWRRPVLFGRPA